MAGGNLVTGWGWSREGDDLCALFIWLVCQLAVLMKTYCLWHFVRLNNEVLKFVSVKSLNKADAPMVSDSGQYFF